MKSDTNAELARTCAGHINLRSRNSHHGFDKRLGALLKSAQEGQIIRYGQDLDWIRVQKAALRHGVLVSYWEGLSVVVERKLPQGNYETRDFRTDIEASCFVSGIERCVEEAVVETVHTRGGSWSVVLDRDVLDSVGDAA